MKGVGLGLGLGLASPLQVSASHQRLQGAVGQYEGRVQSLAEELEATKSGYTEACEEVTALKEQLASLTSAHDQQHLLVQEVGVAYRKSGCELYVCVCVCLVEEA